MPAILLERVIRALLTDKVLDVAKVEFIKWLEEQVKNTDNKVDDYLVSVMKDTLGVK